MFMAKTGGVPLQINNLISKHSTSSSILDFEKYEKETIDSVCHELDKLKKESDFKMIFEQACHCALLQPARQPFVYDRKHSLYENDNSSLKPAFPLVLNAYQEYYWEELIELRRRLGISNSQQASVGTLAPKV